MKITSWNVNSINARIEHLIKYIKKDKPEIIFLQELKCIIEKFPYSEILDNTIGEKLMPIDMLRLKLSFFGAVKFDPRSDKWLRICMFQGAPLPNQLKNFDDKWIYDSLN